MKAKMLKQKIIYIFLILLGSNAKCERLHEQIYSSIEGGAACYRRLNGTHQSGCSSSLNGDVGVVEMVKNVSDAEWLVYNSTAGPYMAVVSTALFNDVIKLIIQKPNNIAGMLVYDNATQRPDAFSPELQCPNQYSSAPDSQCPAQGASVWNEKGTGLLRRDIPFPIFFLPQSRFEEVTKIGECYNKYNSDKDNQKGQPLCSVQLSSFMYAAVNSAVCLRRSASSAILSTTKVCDPLGNYNVYYSLFPRSMEINGYNKSIILVTARIDTASLFDGVAPGAASSVVGMVTNIVSASLLSQMIPVTDADKYDKNVLWTLFNGEAFDYIGSQRVAYDLSKGDWPPSAPLWPTDIGLHIELGQIGGSLALFEGNASWPMRAYAPYESPIPAKVQEFLQILSSYSVPNNITVLPKFSTNLPPSSLHSFRRILQNFTRVEELLEVLLVDHEDTFTNKYYESVLDDYDNIGYTYRNISIGSDGVFISTEELLANGTMMLSDAQVKISKLATSLARALYQQVTGAPYTGAVTASAHLVDEILYCFLQNHVCRLLLAADYAGHTEEPQSERLLPLYVGVNSWSSQPAVYAGHLLALLTGAHRPAERTECDKFSDPGYTFYWLKGWNNTGVCIQTTMNFSQALSPAFLQKNYDFTSNEYSTWTESVWQGLWARVFVRASGAGARLAAVIGALVTTVAVVLTFWLQKYASIVFVDVPSSINSDAAGAIRTVNC